MSAAWSTAALLAWIGRLEAHAGTLTLYQVLEVGEAATFDELRTSFHRLATAAHPDQHRKGLTAADGERLIRAYSLVALAYATLRDPAARARYQRELAGMPRLTTPPPFAEPAAEPAPEPAPAPSPAPVAVPAAAPARATTPPIAVARTRTDSASPGEAAHAHRPRAVNAPGVGRLSFRSGRITGLPMKNPGTHPPPMGHARPPAPASVPPPPPAPEPPPAPTAPPPSTIPPRAASPSRAGTPSRPGSITQGSTGATPAARAQTYFRKGEVAWRAGDLGAALFNLRLAVAADPASPQLRAALAQVEAEMAGKK